jgi:Xaa-Pro aminopeptidase
MNSSVERLAQLRSALHQKSIDILIIPSSDPHIGENIPEYWRIIPWLTGFNGSAATVVITDSFAGLWTDSRYFIQAERELEGSGFEFINPGSYRYNNYLGFIQESAKPGTKIGIDGRIFSIENFRKLKKRIDDDRIIIDLKCDLISDLWIDRPSMPFSPAFDHTLKYSGKNRSEKINEVRALLKKHNSDYQFLTAPDDIMWLLNIRGRDLKYTPLLLSFALVGQNQIMIFND